MSKTTNDGLTRSGRHRLLYSCTHMATVHGVKGLICIKLLHSLRLTKNNKSHYPTWSWTT